MKVIKLILGVLCATALSLNAATNNVVNTQDSGLGDWTLSISGGGTTSWSGDNTDSDVVATFELGHDGKLILPFVAGIRQNIGYSDTDGESDWLFGTKLFSDFILLKFGSFQFDVGANVGALYGDTDLTWVAGPEAVVRLYLKKDVDVFVRTEYPFNLTEGGDDETLVYSLGVRVRF